jgi:glycosyltransferase involved in cell wall biosynthesis
MKTSIVIPMWNEEAWVEQAYQRVTKTIRENNLDAQLVFATDGCTDRTVDIIKDLQKDDSSLILFNYPQKLGRGLALRRAFVKLDTQYIVYMDSDLATDLRHLPKLIQCLDEGADIVTGSRLMKDSRCVRPQRRNWFSRVYNILARVLFRSKMHDHQCGFKGFNRIRVLDVVKKVRSRGWFWDTEILIRGQREGLEVRQFPVIWTDREEAASKVNLWKDAKNMGIELLQLRMDLLPKNLIQMMSFAAVGVSNTLISLTTLLILENTIGRGDWGYYFAYGVGIINSFILNRKFTFKESGVSKKTFGQFAAFVGMYLIAMVLYSETARFVEIVLGVFYLYAGLVGTAVEFLFTFSFSKLLIFREKREKEG